MADNVLNEKQMQAIELIAKGETLTDVARIIGASRTSVSTWKNKNELFKAELNKYIQGMKDGVDKRIMNNINPLIDRAIRIALKGKSDKTSLDAIIYLLNRVLGTPTNKTQDITDTDKEDNTVDINSLLEEIKEEKPKLELLNKECIK